MTLRGIAKNNLQKSANLLCPGMVVETGQDVSANMQIEWILGCSVQEVGALYQLRSERVELDIRGL